MRFLPFGLLLAFGCGSSAATGDDVAPGDSGPPRPDADPCADPTDCPGDTGTFVSALKGADSNPGTKAMPFKSIGAGLAHAKMLGGEQAVFVAQGNYPEKVTLAQGIDLNGGYECNPTSCKWTRDLVMFEATITNQDFEGVLAGAGIGAGTLFGGFKIVGKDGAPPTAPGSVGVTVANAAPTIRGNRIVGGNVTGGNVANADRSIGIALRATGSNIAVIENNDITGGAAISLSSAITFEQISGVNAVAQVTSNILRSGTARRSDGIAAFGAGPGTVISNNDITAGNSSMGASNGIETTSTMTIDGNRINTDPATVGTCTQTSAWCAGIASISATLTITNNVVFGAKGFRSAGVLLSESEVPAGAVILNGNYVNGGGAGGSPSGGARNESAAVVLTIGPCSNCGLKGINGRIRNNILDGGINLNRYAVREDPSQGKTTTVEVLQANELWFAAALPSRIDTLYRQVTSVGTPIDIKSVVLLNTGTTPVASQNRSEDPMIDATWHLGANSACINAGVPTESAGKDFEGDLRPSAGGYDIGADERP